VNNNATLRAIGTEQDTILFDEYIPNNHWKGIRFLSAGDSCMLQYCHLTNGYAIGGEVDGSGGAIYCSNSDPMVQNCLIDSCYAIMYGGGISCWYNSNPIINCNIINGNTSHGGGGIYCYSSNPTISGNTISGDSCIHGGGGGIYCEYYSNAIISDNTISENKALWGGGGIYCLNSSPTISDNTISGNSATDVSCGGGIFCYNNSNPTISGNTISGNSAYNGGGIYLSNSNSSINSNTISENTTTGTGGGGIFCENSSHPIISSNIISENSAGENGGGIWCNSAPSNFQYNEISSNTAPRYGGGIYTYNASFTINKCTIVSNIAQNGGGIYFTNNSNLVSDNCILWGNTPQQIYQGTGSTIQVTYSDIQNSWPGTGNINLYPMFVDSALGDYHLQSNSPCIDTGDPNPIYNDPDFTRADMGCYYFDQGFANPIEIALFPQNPPIIIPAGGGSFDFIIEAINSGNIPQFLSVFCNVTLPNGNIYGPVLGPVSIILDGGSSMSRLRTQNVPAVAPAGNYSYNAYAIVQGDTVSDSFPFVKLGAGEGSFVNNWDNSGESFKESYANINTETFAPLSFALLPNFPNPFNPTTKLTYSLPVNSEVSLIVYDINGREVLRLVEGFQNAGIYEANFDASNLPSGVYFAYLKAESFRQTQKLLLLK
jgi:parallel beta-helix repeat protein